MKQSVVVILLCVFALFSCKKNNHITKIDLSGSWNYQLDSLDKGVTESWFSKELSGQLQLPGSLSTNGIGNEVGLNTTWTGQIVDSSFFKDAEYAKYREPENFKVPFWLQSVKYYKGAAWYQKEITIPESWNGQEVELFLERCHWESRVWVNDMEAGMQNSLGTPHIYNLSELMKPGKNLLTVCIDNRVKDFDPGINSHSISDHTQTNWNGIIGEMYIVAKPVAHLQHISVYPDINNNEVVAGIKINNNGEPGIVKLEINISGPSIPEKQVVDFDLKTGENNVDILVPMGENVKYWNEFHPEFYTMTVILNGENLAPDTLTTTFGMREITTANRQILVNGNPVFLRGTLECAIFPKTGFPPPDTVEWGRIFSVCRAHGLNHLRFHSWCPPEAAFAAADKAGFYLQVECSSWANQSTNLGSGKPFDKYLYDESERMIEAYGNHPSFCMLAYGNEPAGPNHKAFLGEFVSFWKQKDKRRIYVSAAGWPDLEINDYLSNPNPRIQGWGEELKSIINAEPPTSDYDWSQRIAGFTQPVVSHEIGQWCVYPDFKEIEKYDGVVRARNFEIFRESLTENGMIQLADSFLRASGKLQALCYKADIEAALRTEGFGGFQLLDLHDFPGQGTALVGVLNPFWEEKGYISPEEYSRFCNSTVPLVRMKKFTWLNNETFKASVEVAHFGDKSFENCTPEWKISDENGTVIQKGNLSPVNIQNGKLSQLGEISVPLQFAEKPQKLVLEVKVEQFSNSWDFWVYPAVKQPVAGADKIMVAQKVDDNVKKYIENGGTVLLTLKKGTLSAEAGGAIKTGFSSIFWNTAWTAGQGPHTLGVLVNPEHPLFSEFPTEYYNNWQWWDAMNHGQAMNLAAIDPKIQPLIRVIDDWFTNRPLALAFEAKAGKGKILVCSIDLVSGLQKRPEAQQLLYSLQKYMVSAAFDPEMEIGNETLGKLIN
ncbi:MAG: sugar-binding domain-containing protein [Draconibacterium sp.]